MGRLDYLSDYEHADLLQIALLDRATYNNGENTAKDYKALRQYFLTNHAAEDLLPSCVRLHQDSDQFWQFIKIKFGHYEERRQFIRKEMNPLFEYCESKQGFPAEKSISEVLQKFDETGIHAVWQKALERKVSDPEGAITISRTILESVCKHILDQQGIQYDANRIELPDLYKRTAKSLNLSPSQHTEDIFKQILGGCYSVVNGLGALRNKLGDAHGQGKTPVKPAPRHAELAVNLSGSMALYLIETFNAG